MNGQSIDRIEFTRMDGRVIPTSVTPGSNTITRFLATGVYMIKIQAVNKVYINKIAVSQ